MTENEAIKILTLSEEEQKEFPNLKEIYAIAVKALEEVQRYRVIGTVEQCREAVEKMKPKKPIEKTHAKDGTEIIGLIGRCPNCNSLVDELDLCCGDCFQRLDWSDTPEKENA